jgi:cytidylate kinase
VAFAVLMKGVDPADAAVVADLARSLDIEIGGVVTVDGVDATSAIRGPEVTKTVSVVAANPEVRDELVRRQRAWAEAHRGGVVEGRDIGTVVFPEATLKIYLTATDAERARRRAGEAGAVVVDVAAVAADIAHRDRLDSTRATSPLYAALDAVVIDTTDTAIDDVVEQVLSRL